MSYLVYLLVLVVGGILFYKRDRWLAKLGWRAAAPDDGEDDEEDDGEDDAGLAEVRRKWGDSVAEAAWQGFRLGDLPVFLTPYDRAREAGAWDIRYALLDAVNLFPEAKLLALLQSDPRHPTWKLLRARQLMEQAWQARGQGVDDEVAPRGVERYHELLGQADSLLEQIVALDPDDANAYVYRLEIAYWHADGRGAEGFYRAAIRCAPDHLAAMRSRLESLSRHWGGSQEGALAFSRSVSAGSPDGSLGAALVIFGHSAIWHYLHYFAADTTEAQARAYLATPAVRQEIAQAYRRSVASPRHRPSLWSNKVANEVAAIATFIQDASLAADPLRRLPPRPAYDGPWDKLGPPAAVYQQARAWVGLA